MQLEELTGEERTLVVVALQALHLRVKSGPVHFMAKKRQGDISPCR